MWQLMVGSFSRPRDDGGHFPAEHMESPSRAGIVHPSRPVIQQCPIYTSHRSGKRRATTRSISPVVSTKSLVCRLRDTPSQVWMKGMDNGVDFALLRRTDGVFEHYLSMASVLVCDRGSQKPPVVICLTREYPPGSLLGCYVFAGARTAKGRQHVVCARVPRVLRGPDTPPRGFVLQATASIRCAAC